MAANPAPLSGKNILVCVSGSIAAYKSATLVRLLRKSGAFVSVAMTPGASRFIGAVTLSALASEPAYDDLFDNRGSIAHTTLGKNADLVIVAPATATLISKMAVGIADDIVSATLLSTPKSVPVLVAPAMHEDMYDNDATLENIEILKSRGIAFIGPVEGQLAGNDVGRGRMIEPEAIAEKAIELISGSPSFLSGQNGSEQLQKDSATETESKRKVLVVTAGGTREAIDPVRVITNKSTGKMGHAIANAGLVNGYKVILITTSDLQTHPDIVRIDVNSAEEMHQAVMQQLPVADILIMSAAVADVRPSEVAESKLKRSGGIEALNLEPTPDIIADAIKHKKAETLTVAFAAETHNVIENAAKKFKDKGVDLMIANDVTRDDSGFGTNTNKVWIFDGSVEPRDIPTMSKEDLAYLILDKVEELSVAKLTH